MSQQRNPYIPSGVLEAICKIIADTDVGLTGTEIGKFLKESKIPDIDSRNSKWKRLYNAFAYFQNKRQVSNNILKFINLSMQPARYLDREDRFEDTRLKLNKSFAFIGVELLETGKFSKTPTVKTISEAEQKANKLKDKLEKRNVHLEIFKYCKAELVAENYFHTVFESTKSIAEKIREQTSLTEDGAELVDKAFSLKNPLVKINDLSNETKQSEHKGFAHLIKGVFGMFRNITAHAPKITWEINEDDALDILSTISLIHRKLEQAKFTRYHI